MRYALVHVALFFGCGIGVGLALGDLAPAALPLEIVCLLGLIAFAGRRQRWGVYALLVAVFALGFVRASSSIDLFPSWLLLRAQRLEAVTGTVVSYPSLGTEHVTFTLQPDRLPGALRVTWFPAGEPCGRVHFGDRVTVTGSVRLPEPFDGFDYPSYLARRGIFATMLADGDEALNRIGISESRCLRAGDRARQSILSGLATALGRDEIALAQGLLLGDRTALSDEVEEAFRRTGLMHVLAVSGLHLGILLAGAWFVLRWVGLRPLLTYPLIGVFVLVFLWIVGPRVSLVRATLLFAFVGLGSVLADAGWILRRTVRPLNGLAAAAVILLAIHPADLFDAGFQLSFAATAGILVAVLPGIREAWMSSMERVAAGLGVFAPALRYVLSMLAISAAAQAAVTPIVAWHFGSFHPLLLGLNLLVIPLVTVALWAGFPAALLIGVGAPEAFAAPFGWALRGLSAVVRAFASLSFVEFSVAPWFGLWVGALVLFLVVSRRYASGSS